MHSEYRLGVREAHRGTASMVSRVAGDPVSVGVARGGIATEFIKHPVICTDTFVNDEAPTGFVLLAEFAFL
jgi:hypothetical protein